MKTLHTISTGILMTIYSLTANSYATQIENENQLTISIVQIVQPTCNGASNGEISVEVVGGKTPYTYNWNTFPNQHAAKATNLKKGVYFIQVTDAAGTMTYKSIELSDPIQVETKISSTNSNGPTVKVNLAEKKTSEFSYLLNGNIIADRNFADLDIGIHQLIISDNKNCTVVQYIQVYECEQVEIESSKRTEVMPVVKVSPFLISETLSPNTISMVSF